MKWPALRGALVAIVLQPRFDAYHVMNSATVISRNNTLGSSCGAVNGIQRGAIIKVGMNVDF